MEKLKVGKKFIVRTGEHYYEMVEYVGKQGDLHVFAYANGTSMYMLSGSEYLYPASDMLNKNIDRAQLRSLQKANAPKYSMP